MTRTKAKSTISNTRCGKTVSRHDQITSLGSRITDFAASRTNCVTARANQSRKRLGDPSWMILLCQKAIQMGNAGSYTRRWDYVG